MPKTEKRPTMTLTHHHYDHITFPLSTSEAFYLSFLLSRVRTCAFELCLKKEVQSTFYI